MSDSQPSWMPQPSSPTQPRPPREISDKSFIATLLLCLFLGTLGMHRFYVGKMGTGLLMFFTLGGLAIWALIDFFIIISSCFTDKDGKVIKP